MGIEPTFEAWEAPVLPLNYTREWDDKLLFFKNLSSSSSPKSVILIHKLAEDSPSLTDDTLQ